MMLWLQMRLAAVISPANTGTNQAHVRSRVTSIQFLRLPPMHEFQNNPRRRLLKGMAATGVVGLFPGLSRPAIAETQLTPTPACDSHGEPTLAETEGPYFTPNSPERADFREPGMGGTPILLTGVVVSRSCVPLARVLVDLWHADDEGTYDNDGYRCRGHQFTGTDGSSRFTTIVPGRYPGRTRHFHVKFQEPSGPQLTTQFYFPGEPGNEQDHLFRPELLLEISENPEMVGRYAVVLDRA
jgi:protocatechuate 3,4-dioxygenase beta subunit